MFPKAVWSIPTDEKKLYLTFDDGPTPEVTDWVLDELARYDAKATFFVLGKNVLLEPETYKNIIASGHTIGNHSFSHLNGWETEDEVYFFDIEKCKKELNGTGNQKSLLRPPYGRITLSQYSHLSTLYNIVMWDVLSGDFDYKLSGEQCFENCRKHAQPGSIIVFHDSYKGFDRLKVCLPLVVKHFSDEGYTFASL